MCFTLETQVSVKHGDQTELFIYMISGSIVVQVLAYMKMLIPIWGAIYLLGQSLRIVSNARNRLQQILDQTPSDHVIKRSPFKQLVQLWRHLRDVHGEQSMIILLCPHASLTTLSTVQ